jgi:hypothetical protein
MPEQTAPEEIRHEDGRIEHPSVRSEPTDASLGWITGIVIGAAVLGAIICFAVLGFFHQSNRTLNEARKSRFPLRPPKPYVLPPEPRLEQLNRLNDDPRSNIYIRQEEKLDILNGYGPTPESGFIHIPIDRAMRLLAGKLPARDEGVVSRAAAAAMPVGLGMSPLSAAASLFPGAEQLMQESIDRRQNGLVNGGESSSGRLFKKGKPRWLAR